MDKTAYLVLENGKIFKGKAFGAFRDVISEIVFTTGMTGYMETLSDKSYFGQAVVQTFPLIGNYGVIPADCESGGAWPDAYIVKSWCREPSNFRSEGVLDYFLKSQEIPGLYDIDTRSLTKIIRESGVMNGMLTDDPAKVDFDKIKNYRVIDSVPSVSVKEPKLESVENSRFTVALMDYGLKENIKRNLLKRGCNVWTLPYNMSAREIYELKPDGIMLSNGPGDPVDNPEVIATLSELLKGSVPIFGVCLGHQLLALASGFKTTKLKYGHRGANQPVRNLNTGNVYITSQNHGYAVVSDSIDKAKAKELFVNCNDNTCEGIEYLTAPVKSVQFHPEACGGPQDTEFLFDDFVTRMEVLKRAAQ